MIGPAWMMQASRCQEWSKSALPLMSERLDQLISGAQVLRARDGTNEATWNAQHNTLCRAEPAAPNK
jgi:hypothetical protein